MQAIRRFQRLWRARPAAALISVHRGLWGDWPENALPALKAAEAWGIVETDIQLATDGVPVVFHDVELDRMTATSGLIADHDHQSLTALRLRAADGQGAPTAHHIPTLDALLDAAGPQSWYDFDVKHPHEVDTVATWIAKRGQQLRGSVKIRTETPDDITRLHDLQNRTGLMVMAKVMLPRAGLDHIHDLKQADVAAAELWFDDMAQLAQACQIAGPHMAISTYTLDPVHCCGLSDSAALKDPTAVWGRLVDAGVTTIMTDHAADLARLLNERL